MADKVIIVPYDPQWPQLFSQLGTALRTALGETARRIDHIGSTAIPGLDAKPILDIQISVTAFDPLEAYRLPLEGLGYTFRAENPERTKRYFREAPGQRRTHIHEIGGRNTDFPQRQFWDGVGSPRNETAKATSTARSLDSLRSLGMTAGSSSEIGGRHTDFPRRPFGG